MNIRDIITNFDYSPDLDLVTVDSRLEYSKNLLTKQNPYTKKYVISDTGYIYIFDQEFIAKVLIAFETNSLSSFTKTEREFLMEFIAWQNFLLTDPENPIEAGSAEDNYVSAIKEPLLYFNNWLIDELAGTPHPEL